ncbi:MAG: type II secretion system protein [Bacteriovoracaceae bacterium]|nr:type II secretion system protein [Bacteriovoracaceae bacterium]
MNSEKGFSLTQVLIAAAILGGLSLFFMRLMKNMNQSQGLVQSKSDELELRSSIRMILSNSDYCRVSLAGNGPMGSPTSPVVFEKRNIDEENEGLDVALFLSNQAGDTRSLKKFNGSNNPGSNDQSQFGKIIIKSMKLIMNNGVGSNYADSSMHSDIGILRTVIEKKVSQSRTRELIMDFDINLTMATGQSPESSGQTRILSCTSGINIDSAIRNYLQNECKVCIACSDDGSWNNMVICDNFDNDGWFSSGQDYCGDQGRLAIKTVCGTDSYSDIAPNSPR